MHSACRPAAVMVRNAVGRLSGKSLTLLRSGTSNWEPPIGPTQWNEWIDSTSETVGSAVTDVVVLPPSDPHRRRFALVLLDTDQHPVGFVKWTRNPANSLGLEAERRFTSNPPTHFTVPRLLEHATVDGWSFTINEMLTPGPHRPARLTRHERRLIAEEIHTSLTGTAAGGEDDVISHGDFAPWNVRRLATGSIAVIDWEAVRRTPVAADETWHVVTSTLAVGGSPTRAADRARKELGHHDEAAIDRAVTYLLRRGAEQPPEVDSTVDRSVSLIRFEHSIDQALKRISPERRTGDAPPH